jgi:murein DD-endopeptidase MepM/ murein hydrolase activator NlpD
MTLRDGFPKARLLTGCVFVTVARSGRQRTIGVPPLLWVALLSLAPLLCLYALGGTLYFVFHDDMVAALMRRQSEMQFAYEDQLTGMRLEIDRAISRQLLDQDSLEGQVHRLASRQAQLENRAALIAQLADAANAPIGEPRGGGGSLANVRSVTTDKSKSSTLLAERPDEATGVDNPNNVAPVLRHDPHLPAAAEKPRPEAFDGGGFEPPIGTASPRAALQSGERHVSEAAATRTIGQQIKRMDTSLERIAETQMQALSALDVGAQRSVAKLETIFAAIGLSPENATVAGRKGLSGSTGGPFVPLTSERGSPFEEALLHVQRSLTLIGRLTTLVSMTPLQHPLVAGAEITSGFGGRVDPFNGRTAIHTGVDFRGDYGAPVRATATGRVSVAGLTGGYGNMVEIDHGNGLATRYAHLSEISVQEGQTIVAGAVVGAVGSTGRSTGPHLHYETRIDGEPVDPIRFLRAGAKLAADE